MAERVNFVQALTLGVDPSWRRLDAATRRCGLDELGSALAGDDVCTYTYSMIGLKSGADLLLWSLATSLEALEERCASVLRSGFGAWCTVSHSFLGMLRPSQYVRRPSEHEQSLFLGERSRYLVVYPFTKATDWYLLPKEARQGVMNEHIRVGRSFPQVRQLLASSFGLDDMDFLVAYETDDLAAFGDLVRELRSTESRRSTVRDTPILTAIHRPLEEIRRLLGA